MTRRALVYGDVDLNLIDGSAVWVQGVVASLARAGCAVDLVVKAPVRTDRLLEPLVALSGVTIVSPHEAGLAPEAGDQPLSPVQAARVVGGLDAAAPYDLLVVRGLRVVRRFVAGGLRDGRLWS